MDADLKQRIINYTRGLNVGRTGRVNCPVCVSTRTNKNDKSLAITNEGHDKILFFCHYCGDRTSGRIDTSTKDNEVKPLPAPSLAKRDIDNEPVLGDVYLASRGLNSGDIGPYIAFTEAWFHELKSNRPALEFVYRDDEGNHVYSKYRCLTEKLFTSHAYEGKPGDYLYLRDGLAEHRDYVVITEGEGDALTLKQLGLNAMSIPTGANINWLEPNAALLKEFKRVLIWGDSDTKGKSFIDKLKAEDIRITRNFSYIDPDKLKELWPDAKDANDILMAGGTADDFKRILNSCFVKHAPSYIIRPGDLAKQFTRIRDGSYATRVSIGEAKLDRIYSPTRGYTTIVTGIPGHGKTSWLNWYAYRLADMYNWKFVIWSPENDPALHYMDLVAIAAGRSIGASSGYGAMGDAELEKTMEFVQDHYTIVQDYEADSDIDTILQQLLTSKYAFGGDGFIIDPWNYITMPDAKNPTDAIKSVYGKVRKFASEHNVHVWLVAHPTKMREIESNSFDSSESSEDSGDAPKRYKTPGGYDISGSAHFYNMADLGVTIYRDDPITKVIVWKARRDFLGALGETRMIFKPGSNRFHMEQESFGGGYSRPGVDTNNPF